MKDNCTLWFEGNWGHCCEAHDFHYSAMSTISRYEADKHLYKCVKQKSRPIAILMFIGVRLFGYNNYDKGLQYDTKSI